MKHATQKRSQNVPEIEFGECEYMSLLYNLDSWLDISY